jgi:hypothetical protein
MLLMATASSHGTNPAALPASTPYNPVEDFTAIAMVGGGPMVIVVPGRSPHRTIQELWAEMRARPGALSFATSGAGGIGHLTGAYMLARAGGLMRPGGGGVLVKLVKPRQDRRIDLPAIGPDTVAAAAAIGLVGIAIEARQNAAGTILLERDATIAAADAAGLFLQAIRPAALLKETET